MMSLIHRNYSTIATPNALKLAYVVNLDVPIFVYIELYELTINA